MMKPSISEGNMNKQSQEMVSILKALVGLQERGEPACAAAIYSVFQRHPGLDIAANDQSVRMSRIASALRPEQLQEDSLRWNIILSAMLDEFNGGDAVVARR